LLYAGADDVGGVLELPAERTGGGQSEDLVDAVFIESRHRLGLGIAPVTAERDARGRSTRARAPNQPVQMDQRLAANYIAQMRCIRESRRVE
jgi:hypothetical protein